MINNWHKIVDLLSNNRQNQDLNFIVEKMIRFDMIPINKRYSSLKSHLD